MDEPALTFDGVRLSPQKEIVRAFYKDMWDHADKSLIPTIFHPDFTFRGSLGPALVGHDQFAGYVDLVTTAFGNYTSDMCCDTRHPNNPRISNGAVPQSHSAAGAQPIAKRWTKL